jgi:AcrR family transcriptional regulator
MPAAERREMVLEAAVAEFGVHGLAGTSTENVARQAGISQPYLFRLFPTKKALFLALVERCFRRVEDATRAAYKHLWEMVERITGLPFQTVVDFFAIGMLMNVAAAMDLPSVDERWTSWCPKDADD